MSSRNKITSWSKKQRIVHNLSDLDEIIEIALGEDVDMDLNGITLREIFYNHQDTDGN
jgi:hypothetical protein